jgi:hypothetical protein
MQDVLTRVPRAWLVIGVAALAVLPAVAVTQARQASVPRASGDVPWRTHVRVVDEALGRGDVSAATRHWQDAYAVALASRRWDAMLEVGDAFVRIGRASGTPSAAKPNARQAYLVALTRAGAAPPSRGGAPRRPGSPRTPSP